MTRGRQRETAPAVRPHECLRCGGEMPERAGYYHASEIRCIEVLGRRLRELANIVHDWTGRRA